jgi:hypothetical protein
VLQNAGKCAILSEKFKKNFWGGAKTPPTSLGPSNVGASPLASPSLGALAPRLAPPPINHPGSALEVDGGGLPRPVFDKALQPANSCEDFRAARQLRTYLEANNQVPRTVTVGPQCSFRSGHSTETALPHVLSDILTAIHRNDLVAQVFLPLETLWGV